MERNYATYLDLEITPFVFDTIQELVIVKQINEHATLRLKGIVQEEQGTHYLKMSHAEQNISVGLKGGQMDAAMLFQGMVRNIQVHQVRNVYHIELEAVSLSYKLDVVRKERTFQDIQMTYTQLIDQVVQDYSGAQMVDEASNGAVIAKVILQYRETDWEFLKRMASRFYTGLIPSTAFDTPKVHFGLPSLGYKGEVRAFHYRVRKQMELFQQSVRGQIPALQESDCIFYEVETDQWLDIGMEVSFDEQRVVVYGVRIEMEEGLLKPVYTLASRLGASQQKRYNMPIVGVSLQGKVIAVAKDLIKAHLNIDSAQDVNKAFWFPYSTIYASEDNAGWYCMPEIGDDIRIYFPTHKEEDAIAISSVQKPEPEGSQGSGGGAAAASGSSGSAQGNTGGGGNDPMQDPKIKTIKTINGKMIVLAPDHILITGDGVSILLSDADGISITSSKNVSVKATEEVILTSKKVTISAQEKIEMTSKGSSLILEDLVDIKGTQVHQN
ncbi:contractile injection system protein, VgrG/Pvc8 family [Paenibacillus peoriae]|uniref:contractile injection system protein, VgrG/Pvc8 family n=1 Tax=Paenibacillus peoriae TaxID=59893 RepID=UPI00026C568C|nr:contractile injection system protein, VgrG/Pvc8 family [Paenibacillus peoriae]MEC0181028.1 contractile injection system protein, VgrG/Pvc8 family [Paenibacillus peoriae]